MYWVFFGSAFLLAVALYAGLVANPWIAWLLAVNLVTLFTFWYDKLIAGSKRQRVPEKVLLGLALVGGTPGAILGMQQFRHKTAKASFKRKLRLVVGFQLVLLVGYWVWPAAGF